METNHQSDQLAAEERREPPGNEFSSPETRPPPLNAAHVRAPEAYFHYAPESKKAELARRILIKTEQYGVHIQSPTILE